MTLQELAGNGWTLAEPPQRHDDSSVIARYNGEPIKAGFTIEEDERDGEYYMKCRSGQYDVEIKVDFEIGRGQVRVQDAEGYNNEN